jgi:hypothetical protein
MKMKVRLGDKTRIAGFLPQGGDRVPIGIGRGAIFFLLALGITKM